MVIKALDPDGIRIRIGTQPKMLDPDPDEMNADPQTLDPQHWLEVRYRYLTLQQQSPVSVLVAFILCLADNQCIILADQYIIHYSI